MLLCIASVGGCSLCLGVSLQSCFILQTAVSVPRIYVFVAFGVLRCTPECFAHTKAASIIMGRNQVVPGEYYDNPQVDGRHSHKRAERKPASRHVAKVILTEATSLSKAVQKTWD